ncbi:glycosylation-dependent cell adhesion molecule 1-like [Manis pentadactyla]|uniref:glycosylation-dependent cell adhesion molecule 1-like n=1 Tax=Manis pentadactyla TaxID=143292 RepID=UPI0018743B50|nr:glycosylation-dependent cell adhesion molecule 1-like [Manis pentadactyla]
MKFFIILLLASLASSSLAVLNEPEDEIYLQAQLIDASAQIIPSSLPRKDHVSSEDISKEPSISREELVSEKDAIKSPRIPENRQPDLLHSVLREASFRNAALQLEETTELTAKAATTSEGKLAKIGHKIGKNLDKTVKETMNYLKSLLPHAYEVMRSS